MRDDDEVRETPPVVVGAVSVGTTPLPFLAVYAVLFILHGWLRPVHPPDISSSQTGELIAGLIAAAAFVVLSVMVWMFLNGRRRWPFVLGHLVVLGATIWFLVDETKGGAVISALVLATSVLALVLAFAPDSWRHVGRTPPAIVTRLYPGRSAADAGDPAELARSSEPTLVEPATLRRR